MNTTERSIARALRRSSMPFLEIHKRPDTAENTTHYIRIARLGAALIPYWLESGLPTLETYLVNVGGMRLDVAHHIARAAMAYNIVPSHRVWMDVGYWCICRIVDMPAESRPDFLLSHGANPLDLLINEERL